MSDWFWIFLSVVTFMGLLLPIVAINSKHKEKMKELELEELKLRRPNPQSDTK
jgi:hypothetical protein